MRTALRKMGNSTGMIVPKIVLSELGLAPGAAIDLRVEGGDLVVSPVRHPREGWAKDAAAVAAAEEDQDEAAWAGFGNDGDDELGW